MDLELSRGELALLHCLRDGDDPYRVLHDANPIAFARDVARLVDLGLVQRNGRQLALTLQGLHELDEPRNSGPMPLDDYDL
jgi:hypothetical protein